MTKVNMKLAKSTYETLLAGVEANGWKCAGKSEELTVTYGVNGDNLHMNFTVLIDAERQIVRLLSRLPFKFPANKTVEGAIVTGSTNYALSNGSFDFNVTNGEVIFRMATSYCESKISKEVILYLLNFSAWAIDKYYKKLLAVSKGEMSVEEFIKTIE